MSRRSKFYPDPTQDPKFKDIQEEWYQKLADSGFVDQEDYTLIDRPLKHWKTVSSSLIRIVQSGSWDMNNIPVIFSAEEEFQNHPEFMNVCKSICKHGNSVFTPEILARIWRDYCQGNSTRILEKWYNISDNRILVAIGKIREWMNFMEPADQTDAPPTETSTVIVREYNPNTDAPFVYSSWRNNLWYEEKRDDRHSDVFFSLATKQIKRLLQHKYTEVRIACLSHDHDFIVGFSVLTGANIEWVYVRINYRMQGIGRLLTQGFTTVTHPMTKIGKAIVKNHDLKPKENEDGPENDSERKT